MPKKDIPFYLFYHCQFPYSPKHHPLLFSVKHASQSQSLTKKKHTHTQEGCLSVLSLSVGLSVCLFVCLSVCLFFCWSVCRSACLSVCSFVGLSVRLLCSHIASRYDATKMMTCHNLVARLTSKEFAPLRWDVRHLGEMCFCHLRTIFLSMLAFICLSLIPSLAAKRATREIEGFASSWLNKFLQF